MTTSPEPREPAQATRTAQARRWAAGSVERPLALLDRVPGARRLLTELSRVEVIDRSLAIGAQALLALLPLLVVVAAYTPASFGSTVVGQVRDAMGLTADVIGPLRDLALNQGQVRTNTGEVGLLVALLSATSFSRALQRMYAKVFEPTGTRRSDALRSSVVWLCGWLGCVQALSLLGRSRDHLPGGPALAVVVEVCGQVAVWWWTARVMLLWRVPWSRLLPAAVITTAGVFAMVHASALVMPSYARSIVAQFGSVGVVLAAASWLVAFGSVLLVTTMVGRLIAEQPLWQRAVDRVRQGDRSVARSGPDFG